MTNAIEREKIVAPYTRGAPLANDYERSLSNPRG